jgi:hypothetical protein
VIYINRYPRLRFFIYKIDGIGVAKFPVPRMESYDVPPRAALAGMWRRWERRLQRPANGCVHSRVIRENLKEIYV